MFPRLDDDFDLVLREKSAASTNLNSITASWARSHIVSPILRKGFSSSRTSYYPNSVASYQIIRLQLSGAVNPNPGPNGSEKHNSTEQQNSTRLQTFYANARKELIVLCKKKKSLYNRARRSNTTAIWEKYRQLNNSVKKLCNTARWSYIKKLALDLQENDKPKPFWNFVKSK